MKSLYSILNPYPVVVFTSAAYIQVYFSLDFFMEANNMNPDLGPYGLQYRRGEEKNDKNHDYQANV